MFLIPESEQKILKGLEIRGVFVQKVEGYVRVFIALSNGSVFVATTPEIAESLIDSEEVVKKLQYEVQLDPGQTGWSKDFRSTVISPDVLENELRIIRRRIFNSGMIALCPMDTLANQRGSFEEFGKDFEEWYLSLKYQKMKLKWTAQERKRGF